MIKGSWHVLMLARQARSVWLAILGSSWFFAVGAVVLSEFAPLVNTVLAARQEVATLFLIIFSVSIAGGSIFVGKLQKGIVSARYVPASALVMAGFLIDLWIATSGFNVTHQGASITLFLASQGSWHIMFALVGVAFAGGMFIVPLYAVMQTHSAPEVRSRAIAANNIVSAALTVLLVGLVGVVAQLGVGVPGIIGALGFATLIVALIACYLLPGAIIKGLLRHIMALRAPTSCS